MSQPVADSAANGQLRKGLSLGHATAINMIDMVGIGPFVTISIIVGALNGPVSAVAWLLGAVLALMDGLVWAELGSRWPAAGGSYVFLQKLYERVGLGKLMSFLFIWQTTIQAPLVIASGALGFAKYFSFLVPLGFAEKKLVSCLLIAALVGLLYRDIKSIGRISVVLWLLTGGTILWLVFSGIGHFNAAQAFDWRIRGFDSSFLFFIAVGNASINSIYSYLGYYNVCHLGAEIKEPSKNIPRSILLSIGGIALLYLAMQAVVLGVLPWQVVAGSDFVASLFFETVYGSHLVGELATVLILIIAAASLFSAMLGYSRIPYAAAINGDFFKVFGRVHPRLGFPHISLLAIGLVGMVLAILLDIKEAIAAILMMRILVQFISQAVGLLLYRWGGKDATPSFKMPLFPLPALLSIAIWLFIFCSKASKAPQYLYFALGIIGSGVIAFLAKQTIERNRQA
jgi:fructoselysine transporter